MLKLALPYEEKLNKAWQAVVFKEKYQFYNYSPAWEYKIELESDSWSAIQMVSVDSDDEVIGFLSATVVRSCDKVSSVGALNFGEVNITFSRDLLQFLSELFTKHHFRKIEWSVLIGNPAEKLYDKLIQDYDGKVVGILRETTKLADNSFKDEKLYELFKSDFDAASTRRQKKLW